eukprot:scaffold861_cov171-Cylindrotheca_fusiformis.AAC.1
MLHGDQGIVDIKMDDSSSIIDDTNSIQMMDDLEEENATIFDSSTMMSVDNPNEGAADDDDDADIIILISVIIRTFMHASTCLFQQPPTTDVGAAGQPFSMEPLRELSKLWKRRLAHLQLREEQLLSGCMTIPKISRTSRVSFEEWASKMDEKHFRRCLRMSREGFDALCSRLKEQLGDSTFRSQDYIDKKNGPIVSPFFISGEVKVALSIRLLAGGSYLDMVPMFNTSSSQVYRILYEFIDWVLLTFEFPLVRLLRENRWQEIEQWAGEFGEKSNGVFYGPFAALDGLAVRIKSPTLTEVSDPGNYYCRKGFYALNVQAICNKSKKFIWAFPSNKGSTHDSAAFQASRLYVLLKEKTPDLMSRGLFIAGDSAYGLTPFLITPYDANDMMKALGNDALMQMDGFNYHLSSNRIYIECAFGELIMRWGIFWRHLRFSLANNIKVRFLLSCLMPSSHLRLLRPLTNALPSFTASPAWLKIIRACMLLHNFIVDQRDSESEYFRNFRIEIDESVASPDDGNRTQEMMNSGDVSDLWPYVAGNGEVRPRGRPTINEQEMRTMAQKIRDDLKLRLAASGLNRPMEHDMRFNMYGHIYTTS